MGEPECLFDGRHKFERGECIFCGIPEVVVQPATTAKKTKIKGMDVVSYSNEADLRRVAATLKAEVLDTRASFSFRIFKDRKCTEFHVYKKPQQ